jgi:SAM-dependent methyltransferase
LDYSSAVEACQLNLYGRPNLHVVQGDIYALPFARGTFPFVYSLGVLQHTPDVARAFAALPPMLAQGGRLCVDFYERSWKSALLPKYWLRPFTRRMPKAKLFALCERAVPGLLPVSRALSRVPMIGRTLRRVVPVANHEGALPLSPSQLREWALLDTFDWLAPEYDNPQTAPTVRRWLEESGLGDAEVLKAGHLTARGTASHATRH